MKNIKLLQLAPVIFSFFIMGYVDLVGIATNNIKVDFQLTDTISNLLPSMVFLWFLVLSVPTGMLMNKIGRRKTVVLSLVITFLAMMTPLLGYSFAIMLIAFALLGIGNTLMQVSLNPLITNIIDQKHLASSLTFGQFVKAIASLLAPIIAAWASTKFGDWKLLFPTYAGISLIPTLWLYFTHIEESPTEGESSSFKDCFALFADKSIILLFIGILVHVGIDVGVNLTAPKILMERMEVILDEAGYAIVIYFIARTVGCFLGTFILSLQSPRRFFIFSISVMLIGIVSLFFAESSISIYICVVLLGFGNSNMFSMIFSQAMQLKPERNNEISGLMIMGIAGGAVFPVFMGIISDALQSQNGALIVIALCIGYLAFLSMKVK